ncbi:MAG TPA: hypothetical protein VI386_09860 [Candidatus Sulfotelmatobacter sp.]
MTFQGTPPPPIDSKSNGRFIVFGLIVITLLGLSAALELRLVNSPAAKEAAAKIRGDPRVRAEFGADVHIPFAVGWTSGDGARIYADVRGKNAHGYAVVDLRGGGDPRELCGIEVHDQSEGHLISFASHEPPAQREDLHAPPGIAADSLYFVALGDAANSDVDELALFFKEDFGISIKILPPVPLPADAYDAGRQQYIAEMLVQAMAAKYPDLAADPDARMVGILEGDTYIRNFNWRYTYSYREEGKYSIIPTVRLDPGFYRFAPSPAIRMERLRKVAMKAVGLLYLGFKETENPQSVDALEATIDNIDRMRSVYLTSDVRSATTPLNAEGTPCLNLLTVNLARHPPRRPIVPCWQRGDDDHEGSQYHADLVRGRFEATRIDLYRGGVAPMSLVRMNFSYHFDDKVRAFGKSSWQNLDDTVWSADPASIQTISIYGTEFHRITPGNGFSPAAKYRAGPNNSAFHYALLSWENNGWRIDTNEGAVWRYLGCTPQTRVPCYYVGHRNRAGDSIEVTRDPTTGHIRQVAQRTNPRLASAAALDHIWTAIYDGEKIAELDDGDGRTARYHYDSHEYLTDVEADGHRVHYDYDDAYRIRQVIEDGQWLRIHYDAEARPDRLELTNGSAYRIHYSGNSIKVEGPEASYDVTIMPGYFRVVESK